jgi:hypothetical protein
MWEQRQRRRRKSDSDAHVARVRFDISPVCNEFSKENYSGHANIAVVDLFPYKSPAAAYFDGCDGGFGSTPFGNRYNNSGLLLSSPAAAYFDGCDDGFGLTPVGRRYNYSGQPVLPLYPRQSEQDSVPANASSIACATSSTALPDAAANAAIKKLSLASLIHASEENKSRMFMVGKVWELSRDVQGCREVQAALDHCKTSRDFRSVAAQLSGHVWEAMRCPYANHVLRKVVQTIPASSLDFVVQEIVQEGSADVKQFASHRYGCRIMEELLRICRPEQLHELMDHLLAEADELCTHMYGNFVMKAFLQHASGVQCQKLVKTLVDNAVTMGTNFYACAVLAEALQHSSPHTTRALACVLVSTTGLLPAMASHKHGRAAMEAVLLILKGADSVVKALMLPPLKVAKVPKLAKNPRT